MGLVGEVASRISIRAPARGATADKLTPKLNYVVFQSALPRGERRYPRSMKGGSVIFQSTLPRGERRPPAMALTKSLNFNPRSREGSDYLVTKNLDLPENFNPRSREGSDYKTGDTSGLLNGISIHAPARGATRQDPKRLSERYISIHAPARGATVTRS